MLLRFGSKVGASNKPSEGQGGGPQNQKADDQREKSQDELRSIRHGGYFAPNFSTSGEELAKSRTPTDSKR